MVTAMAGADIPIKDWGLTLHLIKETPIGSWVLKINRANVRILAQHGIQQAYIISSTRKGVVSFLTPEEWEHLKDTLKFFEKKINERHKFSGKFHLGVGLNISLMGLVRDETTGKMRNSPTLKNIQELQAFCDSLGMSDLPLMAFGIFSDKNPNEVIYFERAKGGFHCVRVGNKKSTDLSREDLSRILKDNPTLQRLECSLCQLAEKMGQYTACVSDLTKEGS